MMGPYFKRYSIKIRDTRNSTKSNILFLDIPIQVNNQKQMTEKRQTDRLTLDNFSSGLNFWWWTCRWSCGRCQTPISSEDRSASCSTSCSKDCHLEKTKKIKRFLKLFCNWSSCRFFIVHNQSCGIYSIDTEKTMFARFYYNYYEHSVFTFSLWVTKINHIKRLPLRKKLVLLYLCHLTITGFLDKWIFKS